MMLSKPTLQQLQAFKRLHGFTNADAAAITHVSKRTAEQWFSGRRGMPPLAWKVLYNRYVKGGTMDKNGKVVFGVEALRRDVEYFKSERERLGIVGWSLFRRMVESYRRDKGEAK